MAGPINILIERSEISSFRTQLADSKKYANADCLSAERGDSFTAPDLYLLDQTDGGINSKADTKPTRIVARRSATSTIAWAHGEAGTLTSINPGNGRIHVAPATTDCTSSAGRKRLYPAGGHRQQMEGRTHHDRDVRLYRLDWQGVGQGNRHNRHFLGIGCQH